jgi:surface antigen
MTMKPILAAAVAVAAFAASAASAQSYGPRDGRDGNSSYNSPDNRADQNGYQGENGAYRGRGRHYDGQDEHGTDGQRGDSGFYYRQGAYEENCHRGNATTGTIFGALAGGLIGGAVSHGNGGAVVGGAVVGGLLGNTVSKDISCDDQPYAFRVYSDGLNGRLGHRYDWNHGEGRGYFVPVREYRRGYTVCRDFTETTFNRGRRLTRNGTACRAQDGNWRFD